MIIKHIVQDLINHMGFDKVDIEEKEIEGRVKIDISLPDAHRLIGEKGDTLVMFQHLCRRIVSRQVSPPPMLDIDINRYKYMREGVLRDFAIDVAGRVRLNKKAMELEPMPSFDRRVIHLALANFSDLTTESIGEGGSRYIVIRPYP